MSKHTLLLLGFITLIYATLTNAEEIQPPAQMIDKGACPFECCTYREWTVEEDTELLSTHKPHGKVITTLQKGTLVNAITGIVKTTKPGLVRVSYDDPKYNYRTGDLIYVYTYTGEGIYKVWKNGKMYLEEISFLAGWSRCEEDNTCWGQTVYPPESEWWIQIDDNKGNIGWTNQHYHFGNNDACG